MKHKCKITVIQRPYFPEIAQSFGYGVGGTFCSEAWAAIGH